MPNQNEPSYGWHGLASWQQLLLIALVVTLLGEVRVHPFGTAFRFSLAPVGFVLLLLLNEAIRPLVAGAVTGLMVIIGRVFLETLTVSVPVPWWQPMVEFAPSGLYYLAAGTLLQATRIHRQAQRPLLLFALLAVTDTAANVVEMLLRGNLPGWAELQLMGLVALGRTAVSGGMYYIYTHQQAEWRWEQERQVYQSRLLFRSRLYAEVVYLQKSSRDIEQAVARSFRLYEQLGPDRPMEAAEALTIARDFHEVKKDYQRILYNLDQLLRTNPPGKEMRFSEVMQVVVAFGHRHAVSLGKELQFESNLAFDFVTSHYLLWLSLLDNLVTNAVEASRDTGVIRVSSRREGELLIIRVADQGHGISPADRELIFHPGFTTKADPATGMVSSGLGLTQVKTLAEAMRGRVELERTGPAGTVFRLTFPLSLLADNPAAVEERLVDGSTAIPHHRR